MALISADQAHAALESYDAHLTATGLADQSRRAYRSRVAGYLSWLSGGDVGGSDLGGGDPLADRQARDRAVREYRAWVTSERRARPSTVNAMLTAVDHFYSHLGLGPAEVVREELPDPAPRILDEDQQRRFLDAVAERESVRDRAIAYALFYTGVRVAELVSLDLPDVVVGRQKSRLVVRGSGGSSLREVPLRAEPVELLRGWIRERRTWRGADDLQAFFLNRRGGRLTSRSVDDLVVRLGREAGIGGEADAPPVTPHVLRHTFGARLLRGGASLVAVAELMGHKRLDTTRRYTPPDAAGREHAIDLLLAER
ncbi:tyrosine-type recombinase/integrase [Actinopolymorpha sp. B11F2]|uniref:tyrosine-type recombinase/integrase n=1 Tax=Actinopolymorpha sp. B11F2 TaxID=3160862 RepID=UPI0032E3B933